MLGPILQRMTKPGTNHDLVVVDIDNEMEFSEEHKVSRATEVSSPPRVYLNESKTYRS